MMEGPPDGNDRPYYLTPNDVTEWLKMNYKLGKDGHMPKSAIYDDYLDLCELRGAKPIISPTFYGKLVKRAFPGIQSIRKGPRGQVRQCYARLKKRKNPVALPSDDDTSARDAAISSGSSGSVHRQDGQADSHHSGHSSQVDHQAHRSPPTALHPAGYIRSYPHMPFNLPPVAPVLDARHPSMHHPTYLAHLPTHPQHFAGMPFPTPAYPGMMNLPTPQGYRLDADRQPYFIDGFGVKHEQEEWRDGNRVGGIYDGRDHGASSGREASHGGGLPEPSWTSLRRPASSHSFHERHGNHGEEAGSGSESPGSLESPSGPQLPPFYHPSQSGLPDPSQALPHPLPRHYTALDSYSYGDPDRSHMATRTLSDPYAAVSPLHFSSLPLLQSPSVSAPQLPAIPSPSLSRPGLTPHHPFMPSHVTYSRQLPDLHGGPSSSSAATSLLSLGGSTDSLPRYVSAGPSANSTEKDDTRSS